MTGRLFSCRILHSPQSKGIIFHILKNSMLDFLGLKALGDILIFYYWLTLYSDYAIVSFKVDFHCRVIFTSRRMSIVLETFTSTSTKFVDLSYHALLSVDAMKALQRLVALNALVGGKLNIFRSKHFKNSLLLGRMGSLFGKSLRPRWIEAKFYVCSTTPSER